MKIRIEDTDKNTIVDEEHESTKECVEKHKHGQLKRGNLFKANLKGANLRGAEFGEANLRESDFTDADLRDADLSKADVKGASFEGANLWGAKLPVCYFQTKSLAYDILLIDDMLRIGCEKHTLEEWSKRYIYMAKRNKVDFTDSQVEEYKKWVDFCKQVYDQYEKNKKSGNAVVEFVKDCSIPAKK